MTKQQAIETLQRQYCADRMFCGVHTDGQCMEEECEIYWAIEALKADPNCVDCPLKNAGGRLP